MYALYSVQCTLYSVYKGYCQIDPRSTFECDGDEYEHMLGTECQMITVQCTLYSVQYT